MQCQRPGNPGEANNASLNSSNHQPIRLCSTGLVTPTVVAMDNVSLCLYQTWMDQLCLPAPVMVPRWVCLPCLTFAFVKLCNRLDQRAATGGSGAWWGFVESLPLASKVTGVAWWFSCRRLLVQTRGSTNRKLYAFWMHYTHFVSFVNGIKSKPFNKQLFLWKTPPKHLFQTETWCRFSVDCWLSKSTLTWACHRRSFVYVSF